MRDSLNKNSVNMFSKIFPARISLCLCFYMCVFVCFARFRSLLTFTSVISIVSSLPQNAPLQIITEDELRWALVISKCYL